MLGININEFKDKKIVVFGDFMIDKYINGSVSRISPEAPVPVVHVGAENKRLGGAGNVVLNLRSLGASVCAAGVIGSDSEGKWLVESLNDRGVDTSGIMQIKEMITGIKTRITAQNQQLLRYDNEIIRDAPESYECFLRDNADNFLQNACAVIISDYGKGVVTANTAGIIIKAAKKRNIPVMVDPKGTDYSKYYGASICTPNMKELEAAAGRRLDSESGIAEAGKELCEKCGFDYVLATRSEKGMSLIADSGEKNDFPAVAKEVVDVTGAGDTVISVFTLCYALGFPNDECCRLANVAASIVVSKFGAASVTIKELSDCLAHNSDQKQKKRLSISEAVKKAEYLRAMGKKIVFTNGCFDIVHAGHISSFKQARSHGDVLFVGLNSDASIRRIKGDKRPIVSEEDRACLLEAVSLVDYIVIFDSDTPEELIQKIKPDVLIKGSDWEGKNIAGGEFVKSNGGEVCFIDMKNGLSTSMIVNRIVGLYGRK